MPIKTELIIKKSTKYPDKPYEASINFIADGKPRCGLTLGRNSIMEAAMDVVEMIESMAPNASQAELDDYYLQWDKVPPL